MPKCQCYGRSPFAHLAELSFDVALSGISGHGGGMYFVGDPRLRVARDAAHGGGILPTKKTPRACAGLGQAAAQEHDSGLGLVANSTCVKLQAAARQIVSKLPRPVSCNAAALSPQIKVLRVNALPRLN